MMLLEDLWGGGMWQEASGPLPISHKKIETSIADFFFLTEFYQYLVSLEEDLKSEMKLSPQPTVWYQTDETLSRRHS